MSERSQLVMRLTAERSKLSNDVRSAWSSDGEQRSRWSTFIIITIIIIIIINAVLLHDGFPSEDHPD